jgi:hypothetical protein
MENVQNTYQSDIPWYSYVQCHSETDVVGSLCGSTRTRQNLEKLYRESILRIIWPLPGLLTILQKTFEEANRTGHWTGYLLGSL